MSYGTIQIEKMTTESGYSLGAGNASSFKNRFINGAQVIDQRNAGASVTPTIDGQYLTDRFTVQCSAIRSNTSWQQVDVPAALAGFKKALKFTANSASTVGSSDFIAIGQPIEGYNWADFNWGTSDAKSVTFTCWVYGSVTGTFGGLIKNHNQSRTYPFLYTISSANTWTQINVTIPGDTSGTYASTTSGAVWVELSLACGSTYLGTPLAWNGSVNVGATGQSNAYATTAGATFYTTGWQIEAGTVATSFDFRSIGTELQLCQRYYEKSYNIDVVPGTGSSAAGLFDGGVTSNAGSVAYTTIYYKVTKRANATVTGYSYSAGTAGSWAYDRNGGSSIASTVNFGSNGQNSTSASFNVGAAWAAAEIYGHWTASAEL